MTPAQEVRWLRQRIDAERAWIRSHGGDLDGYVRRYGTADDPRVGLGGPHAYAADVAELDRHVTALAAIEAS